MKVTRGADSSHVTVTIPDDQSTPEIDTTGESHYESLKRPTTQDEASKSSKHFKNVKIDSPRTSRISRRSEPEVAATDDQTVSSEGKPAGGSIQSPRPITTTKQTAQVHPAPCPPQTQAMTRTEVPTPLAGVSKGVTAIPETNCWMSILTFVCFNPLFGCAALYFSLRSASKYRDGDKASGARSAFISIVISLVGISLTMILVSGLVGFWTVNKHKMTAHDASQYNPLGL